VLLTPVGFCTGTPASIHQPHGGKGWRAGWQDPRNRSRGGRQHRRQSHPLSPPPPESTGPDAPQSSKGLTYYYVNPSSFGPKIKDYLDVEILPQAPDFIFHSGDPSPRPRVQAGASLVETYGATLSNPLQPNLVRARAVKGEFS